MGKQTNWRSQISGCNSFMEKSDWGRLLNLSENWILHLYEGETRGRQENALDFSIFPLLSTSRVTSHKGLSFKADHMKRARSKWKQ